MKIIDAEWEELPPAPMPKQKANRGNKFYFAVNVILLGAICKMACTAFYWASLLR